MGTRPEDIFTDEDRDFYSGFSDELSAQADPQDEEEIAGTEFFQNEESGFDASRREHMDAPIEYEYVDESLLDLNFSQFNGDLKSSLKQIGTELKKRKPRPRKVARKKKSRLSKVVPVKGPTMINGREKEISRVLVPRDRAVRVEGASNFILSTNPDDTAAKTIGFYKGKPLKPLILIMNNDSPHDFTVELFNPSQMMDYLVSNTGNLNNKIMVAGGTAAQYSDIVWYMLANPTMIINGKFIVSGAAADAQRQQRLGFKNKNLMGEQFISPLSMSSNLDTMQFQSNTLNFDILRDLGRPSIPDGMETITYTVLAGNTVTFCFYYKQVLLRNEAFQEARNVKQLSIT